MNQQLKLFFPQIDDTITTKIDYEVGDLYRKREKLSSNDGLVEQSMEHIKEAA